MMATGLRLTGFTALKLRLAPRRFKRDLEREVGKATKRNALIAEGAIKEEIYRGGFAPNAPLTVAIKESSRPLVDSGTLAKAVVGEAKSWKLAEIGVLRNRGSGSMGKGKSLVRVAAILHSGARIKVTEKMRRYFALMSRLYPGRWKPLRASTKFIVIPPRPYLQAALTRPNRDKYMQNWTDAVLRAL